MRNKFTKQAQTALTLAKAAAIDFELGYIGTEHLLLGLLSETEGTAGRVLEEFQVDGKKLVELIDKLVTPAEVGIVTEIEMKPAYSPRTEKVLESAVAEAQNSGCEKAGTEHLLLAMLRETDCVGTRLLYTMGVNIQKLYAAVLGAMGYDNEAIQEEFQAAKAMQNLGGSPTPALDQYSRDLTQMAAEGKLDPVVGREKEISRLIQILSRRTKNNPCLVGEPGVGKTAIAEGLAQRILAGSVPETIKDKRLVVLDLSGMVAGSKYRGEFEERIRKVVDEVRENQGILLFIDELHTIIGAGGAEGAMDASNILKPAMARGEIQIIGATTLEEYRKHIEKDAALERRFQPVTVEPASVEQTIKILKGLRPYYESHHQVQISDEALEAAARLSDRYVNDRFLPDKAIDLMDEAAAGLRMGQFGSKQAGSTDTIQELLDARAALDQALMESDLEKAHNCKEEVERLEHLLEKKENRRGRKSSNIVTEEQIAEAVAKWTKIPVQRIAEAESQKLRRLEKTLHKRVIGQDEAVQAVAKAVKRGRVGLKDPKRPIGSFLFLGPTGVGKTELSKALAEVLFGKEDAMIRVDMSEYMEKHSVSKIIGSPPGYVGFGEGGQLSEQIRRHPYSVILFDEIEKAHPDVFNILLQVLDDGHITDSNGRKVDFKNTVIIMTSNAGANRIIAPKYLGFSVDNTDKAKNHERMKKGVMEEVKQIFRPEFLNRIDETIVFAVLTKEEVKKIAKLFIDELKVRLLNEHQITLKITSSAMDLLADKGYDENYGARPLRRVIQNEIEDVLADKILEGTLSNGQTMTIGKKDKKLTFSVKETSK